MWKHLHTCPSGMRVSMWSHPFRSSVPTGHVAWPRQPLLRRNSSNSLPSVSVPNPVNKVTRLSTPTFSSDPGLLPGRVRGTAHLRAAAARRWCGLGPDGRREPGHYLHAVLWAPGLEPRGSAAVLQPARWAVAPPSHRGPSRGGHAPGEQGVRTPGGAAVCFPHLHLVKIPQTLIHQHRPCIYIHTFTHREYAVPALK